MGKSIPFVTPVVARSGTQASCAVRAMTLLPLWISLISVVSANVIRATSGTTRLVHVSLCQICRGNMPGTYTGNTSQPRRRS